MLKTIKSYGIYPPCFYFLLHFSYFLENSITIKDQNRNNCKLQKQKK